LIGVLSFPLGLGISHPIVKSLLAIFLKMFPQTIMARKIWQVGGKGIAMGTIVNINIMNLLRSGIVSIDTVQSGWDTNRWPILLAEVVNAFAWFAVSLAWLKDKVTVKKPEPVLSP
jgi:uncharacterized protein with PQ loop repeat